MLSLFRQSLRYYSHSDACNALRYVSQSKLDERIIRADLDPGYKDGRQYGRGKSGGQVRDEYREDYDSGRGGWGHMKAREQQIMMEEERERNARDMYYQEHNDIGGIRMVPQGEAEQYVQEEIMRGETSRFRAERDGDEDM